MLRGQRDSDCQVSRGFADTVSKNVGAGAAQAAAASRHPATLARTLCPFALPCPPLTAYSVSIFSRKTPTSRRRQTSLSNCSNTFPPSARVCPTHTHSLLFPLSHSFRSGTHSSTHRKRQHPPACPKWLCPLNTVISRFSANPNTILPRTCEPSSGTDPSFQTFI